VVRPSFGERGESAKAWRAGHTLEEIKAIRREEAENAAAALGAEIEFFDAGDYPLLESPEPVDRRVMGSPGPRHRTGHLQVEVELDLSTNPPTAIRAANVRTAPKLVDGTEYPRSLADGA
jgi:LmbE family N-acetylglucosaminyl deacetylase